MSLLTLADEGTTWRAPEAFPSLVGVRRLCVDVETYDPDLRRLGPGSMRDGRIVGLAIGTDDGRRFYFPVGHEAGGNMDEQLVRRWCRQELDGFSGEIVGARLIYDLEYLATWGVTFPRARRFLDVQVAEPLLDEWSREYNLGALSRKYLGTGKEEDHLRRVGAMLGFGDKDDEIKDNLWRLHASHVGAYAEGDVDRPLRILPLQEAELARQDLLSVWDVECRLLPCLREMRTRGVRVDMDKAVRVREDLVRKRDEWLAQLKRLAGPSAEFMAAESLAPALRARGIDVPKTPKSGAPSITKQFLAKHGGDELINVIAEGRSINTVINTFVDGHVLGHAVRDRVHCQFKQIAEDDGGTIARLASSDPNLQNVPSRDPVLGPLIRGMFIPEDGEEWEKQDQSQVEYRVGVNAAVGRGAEAAREAYRTDPKTDFHKMTAEMIGVDPEDKIKRRRVKNVNFATVNGSGARTIAHMYMDGDVAAAERFLAEYNARLPWVSKTMKKIMEITEARGYTLTLLKRRQRFIFWEPIGKRGETPLRREAAEKEWGASNIKLAMLYAAPNRHMQGSAADIVKKWMADARDAGLFAPDALGAPLLTVHDELDVSVPRTPRANEAARELKLIGETCVKMRVPLIVEAERGASWGECG